jgi:hypothetical protein
VCAGLNYECSLFSGYLNHGLNNLTFNFNFLLGIPPPYVSFSMQFPTVEECDFDRQFLFDEYVAISRRYDLKRVSLKS